jgi:hypothetical protein
MKALVFSLLFMTLAGASPASAWTVSVKATQFHYNIEYTPKVFFYQDAYIKKEWPVKACNKKVFDGVEKNFLSLFKKKIEIKSKKKHPDEIIYQDGKKSWRIVQASPFGIFLTQFPNRVISLMTAEEQACGKRK